ncbi:hypothetical protein C6500_12245 [Candidatus Poribacteria bacterium]|nr:MAG: hypothetical protein C6500_12245 [Candidatus Poribacteria bacterium]
MSIVSLFCEIDDFFLENVDDRKPLWGMPRGHDFTGVSTEIGGISRRKNIQANPLRTGPFA